MRSATTTTALVLVCICVVDAQNSPSRKMYTWEDDVEPSSHLTSHRPAVPSDITDFSPSVSNRLSNDQEKPWDVQDDIRETTSLPTRRWRAPEYHKSLQDFDNAIAKVTSHFALDAFSDKGDKNLRYIVIASVVNDLSHYVAVHGWTFYDRQYEDLVKVFIEKAMGNARMSAEIIKCEFYIADLNIKKMRKTMGSPWVKFVCGEHPSACDTIDYAIVKMSLDKELKHQADVLLKLGHAASVFLKTFAGAFGAISAQNAYLWLIEGKETLRQLVQAISEAATAVGPQRPDCPMFSSSPSNMALNNDTTF